MHGEGKDKNVLDQVVYKTLCEADNDEASFE